MDIIVTIMVVQNLFTLKRESAFEIIENTILKLIQMKEAILNLNHGQMLQNMLMKI